jgi:hypothetical protein
MSLSDSDVDRVAAAVAEKMASHPAKCLMFSEDDVAGIKQVAALFTEGKKRIINTMWFVLCLGTAVIFGIGLVEWLKKIPKG